MNTARLAAPAAWAAPLHRLRARWRALGARERRLLALAAGELGAFLLWSVAIQPAWRTLRAMTQGTVSTGWAKTHHELWYRDKLGDRFADRVAPRATPAADPAPPRRPA